MSEKHKRNGDGDVILDNVDFGYTRKNRAQTLTERNERSFWVAVASFVGIFSIMTIALGVTMVGNHSLAAQLDDMTQLYNFEVSKQQHYVHEQHVNTYGHYVFGDVVPEYAPVPHNEPALFCEKF